MRVSPTSRWQLRLAGNSFVLLFLAAVGLVLWLSREYHIQFDWTYAGQNSLSETSVLLLQKLNKPVKVTAFATDRPELRQGIRNIIERYRQHYKDITLEFVDPDKDPARVRAANVRYDGELRVEYGDARESLPQATEEALTNTLARLGRGGERWVVFLGGHRERSPEGQASYDLSTWAQQFGQRGLKTRVLLLGEHAQVPQNTSTLVIAGVRAPLLPGEVKAITTYLKNGGNMLWLSDPTPAKPAAAGRADLPSPSGRGWPEGPGEGEAARSDPMRGNNTAGRSLYGLAPVAEMLGIEFEPGVIVDPVAQALTDGASATFVVIAKYGHHPVVRDFNNNFTTLFPEASALRTHPSQDWQVDTLLDTSASAWLETGTLGGEVRFDPGKDTRGPLTLGVALTRRHEGKQQRVAVIADGDFLSNTYIGNGGNLDLGMNLINWTGGDDAYLNIPTRTTKDMQIDLSHTTLAVTRLGFLIVLPLILAGGGLLVWWRRRKR